MGMKRIISFMSLLVLFQRGRKSSSHSTKGNRNETKLNLAPSFSPPPPPQATGRVYQHISAVTDSLIIS